MARCSVKAQGTITTSEKKLINIDSVYMGHNTFYSRGRSCSLSGGEKWAQRDVI